MRILLTGATGYIGESVLDTFVRAGHAVTALVRNPARLARIKDHVNLVTADFSKPGPWTDALDGHDVFIHTAFESSARGPEVDRVVVEALVAACQRATTEGRPAVLIYTSGVWVLGPAPRPVDESAALDPSPIVAWRPAHEQLVLDAAGDGLRTAVVRPGIVFGGGRGIVGDLLRDAANGLVRIIGDGQNRWPLIHVRDLADLYLRLATTPGAGGIFHATDDSDERVIDMVEAIGAHMQHTPDVRHVPIAEARAKHGPVADALVLDQIVRSTRSRALGWDPSFKSITANVATLVEEWRRNRE